MKHNLISIFKSFLAALVLVMVISCSNSGSVESIKKRIQFGDLSKADLGDQLYTGVRIIKTYANEDICTTGDVNANLYICRNEENTDTIYVFDMCDKVPAFAKEELYEVFVIDHENILSNWPKEVVIEVPKSFLITHHSKYVFASITRLID